MQWDQEEMNNKRAIKPARVVDHGRIMTDESCQANYDALKSAVTDVHL